MKYIKTYKIFESDSSIKLIDNYYKEADVIRDTFSKDMDVLMNRFDDDVADCMHDLTDHSEWIFKNESDGPFYRSYIFRIPVDDLDEFGSSLTESLTKLENHLGVKYLITYVNGQHDIGDLSDFTEWYSEVIHKFENSDDVRTFKVYIGDTKDRTLTG